MDRIRDLLKKAILKLYGVDFEPEVTEAPGNIEADYSSNAPLKLAGVAHKSPMVIAEELVAEVQDDSATEMRGVQSFATAPGFINFISSDEYLLAEMDGIVTDFDKNISSGEYRGKTVVCEFSDPNPFKVLHVGHLYTSVVGDAIARLLEYAGAKVVRANFGGDVGLHVAKTMYILQRKQVSELTIEDIAKCYIEGTAAYEDDAEAKAEITRLNKEIYKINAEDIHGTPLADLYWRGRELSYDYFKHFYASIGLKFDKYYPESTVAWLGLATVKREEAAGVYEESDGAVVFDGEKYGLHTRVFINKEGVPTYEAKDVGLIFQKEADYHFDKSIVITGSEQLDYMKVVLKSVEQYAPELVARTVHLTHGLVKLPGGVKMSSRKGNFLKAVDVLDMVATALAEDFGSDDRTVSLAATKYAFLKYKMGGDIIFDPRESVKMTGNSGPYLLYSCVRAKRIVEGASSADGASVADRVSGVDGASAADGASMVPEEHTLMRKIAGYRDLLDAAVAELAPHKVANYLYEVSQEFSRFYEKCPVVGAAEEGRRVRMVQAYLAVMTHGLGLLGMEIPEKM
ncbi:arginine--tRNA ligase [Candidatus Saccharibacteria bacterium]|nr:arginine--tRNA ligase [Candidatus Saccharibacteria bacterium]